MEDYTSRVNEQIGGRSPRHLPFIETNIFISFQGSNEQPCT